MIHNKSQHILKQFLGDYRKEIYGRECVGRLPMSQKSIALALGSMEKEGILRSKRQGSMKYFRLNTGNPALRDVITASEIFVKNDFLRKHRKLADIFRKDDRIVGIFGSYAEGTQKKDSDIDLFIIGKRAKEDYDKEGRKLDLDISIRYFAMKDLERPNNLCKEIIRNHIIIFGAEKFVNILWSGYYDLD